jgi:hypothetical protein
MGAGLATGSGTFNNKWIRASVNKAPLYRRINRDTLGSRKSPGKRISRLFGGVDDSLPSSPTICRREKAMRSLLPRLERFDLSTVASHALAMTSRSVYGSLQIDLISTAESKAIPSPPAGVKL